MNLRHFSGVEHASNQEYVHRVNVKNGWYDRPVSFLEAMALMMTEVVEIGDAGLGVKSGSSKADPQMASEFADCYIRLVDNAVRFDADLSVIIDAYQHSYTKRAYWSFDGMCMQLMRRVRDAVEAYRKEGPQSTSAGKFGLGPDTRKALAHFYLQLQDTCDDFGVSLPDEFSRKMAVNETRGYRHGNKFA